LSFVELTYNKSYQANNGMTLYKALYGRNYKCICVSFRIHRVCLLDLGYYIKPI